MITLYSKTYYTKYLDLSEDLFTLDNLPEQYLKEREKVINQLLNNTDLLGWKTILIKHYRNYNYLQPYNSSIISILTGNPEPRIHL